MLFFKSNKNKELSDLELIQKYKESGNNNFVATLFDRYSHLVFGLCVKYLKDKDESKDAVLEIFEKLMIDLKTHDVKNFKSWLYMVAKNYCLMLLREQRAMQKKDNDFQWGESDVDFSLAHNIYDEKEQKLKLLEESIKMLNSEQRICIELFFIQEKCYAEVAAITGFDMNSVKSYIQNGKRNIKIILTNQYGAAFAQ